MALTRRDQKQLSQFAASGSTARLVQMLGQAAGRAVRSYLDSGKAGGGNEQTGIAATRGRGSRKRKSPPSGQPRVVGQQGSIVNFTSPYAFTRKRMTVVSREAVTTTDPSSGNVQNEIKIAFTDDLQPMNYLFSQSRIGNSMFMIITQHTAMKIHAVRVRVIGVAPNTVSGYVAIGYSPDMVNNPGTSLSDLSTMCNPVTVVPAHSNGTISFRPSSTHNDNTIFRRPSGSTATLTYDLQEMFLGSIFWNGNIGISGAAPPTAFILEISSDVEVWGV